MAEKSQSVYQFLELSSPDEPLILSGPPRKIRGKIEIANNGSQRVRVRDASIHSPTKKTRKGTTVMPGPQRLVPVVLRPGHTRRVPLSLALDPHTPPGEYQAELTIGDRIKPVTLNVVENIELNISPGRFVLANEAGATVTRRVVLTNQGNVPLKIGEIGAVPLDDDLIVCRTLRAALKAVDEDREKKTEKEEEPTLSDYVAEIFHQAKIILDKAGNLRVHNKTGEVTIPPGGSTAIDLEIRLPDTLEKRTRYFGTAAIYTSQLTFVIVPTTQ